MKKDYTHVIKKIDEIAEKVYSDLEKSNIPFIELPARTKTNIF
ncbi:MAG TPA: DNA topoisomerase VI, partial [Thermoplasmatales archaeon]|nr:DNA topoisomerase VI [Thermoplasmatales archaeon]